jgi:hypothetical protein
MIALFDFGENSHRYASHPGRTNLAPFLAYVHAQYHVTKAFSFIEVWERKQAAVDSISEVYDHGKLVQ